MNAALLEAATRAAGDDPDLKALLAELPEEWARIPADESGVELFLAYMRQAYGAGYIRALSEDAPPPPPPPGPDREVERGWPSRRKGYASEPA